MLHLWHLATIPVLAQLAREKGTLVTPTDLRINQNTHDVNITAHGDKATHFAVGWCSDHEVPKYTVTLRQIGWIDQAGNVYVTEKEWRDAGGPNGSITPLLVNPGCD